MSQQATHTQDLNNKNERMGNGSFVFLFLTVVAVYIDQCIKQLAFANKLGRIFKSLPTFISQSNFKNFHFSIIHGC